MEHAFARLERELRREWRRGRGRGDLTETIAKYARLGARGQIRYCYPGSHQPAHSVGKVIYPNAELARQCAQELSELFGDPPQTAYLCDRSRHGHHHLTSRRGGESGWPRSRSGPETGTR